jgi:predicted  nucleic acid-binding Zn-ribbon protein
VADPIVPVFDGSCSACFYAMTGQDMQELYKNKLLQCRGCYRFVYLPQETHKERVSQDSEK